MTDVEKYATIFTATFSNGHVAQRGLFIPSSGSYVYAAAIIEKATNEVKSVSFSASQTPNVFWPDVIGDIPIGGKAAERRRLNAAREKRKNDYRIEVVRVVETEGEGRGFLTDAQKAVKIDEWFGLSTSETLDGKFYACNSGHLLGSSDNFADVAKMIADKRKELTSRLNDDERGRLTTYIYQR